jgi:hypothetical protein
MFEGMNKSLIAMLDDTPLSGTSVLYICTAVVAIYRTLQSAGSIGVRRVRRIRRSP